MRGNLSKVKSILRWQRLLNRLYKLHIGDENVKFDDDIRFNEFIKKSATCVALLFP